MIAPAGNGAMRSVMSVAAAQVFIMMIDGENTNIIISWNGAFNRLFLRHHLSQSTHVTHFVFHETCHYLQRSINES